MGFGEQLHTWQEWTIAIGILVATFILTRIARFALGKTGIARTPVAPLIPSLTRLLYVVGLFAFLDAAPIHPRVLQWISSAVYVTAVVVILSLIRRAALLTIEWSILRTNHSATLRQGFIPLMRNLITLFVMFAGAIMILQHFHYDVLSLLTALGVGSLAVGLAAKDTLSNMISGFTLIIDRNLRPGDRINLAGNVGDVQEIGLRSTRLLMPDGNTLIVPNAELVNTRIINLSMPRRETTASASVRVPATVPFARVREICLDVASQVSLIRKDPKPGVTLTSLGDGHQLVTVGFWVEDFNDGGGAVSDFNERLVARLASEGIAIVAPGARN